MSSLLILISSNIVKILRQPCLSDGCVSVICETLDTLSKKPLMGSGRSP